MSNAYRTFIALKIYPEDKLAGLFNALKSELSGEALKWVEPDNLHLTLKFLGDTNAEQVEEVKEILFQTASQFSGFQFQLKGLGYFKSNGQPRVLFAKIENFESLKQLVDSLQESLEEIGFEKDERAFKPHLTLARIKFIKNKRQFYSLVENADSTNFQPVNVNEIIYYQSILKPSGPEYIPLHKVQLKA